MKSLWLLFSPHERVQSLGHLNLNVQRHLQLDVGAQACSSIIRVCCCSKIQPENVCLLQVPAQTPPLDLKPRGRMVKPTPLKQTYWLRAVVNDSGVQGQLIQRMTQSWRKYILYAHVHTKMSSMCKYSVMYDCDSICVELLKAHCHDLHQVVFTLSDRTASGHPTQRLHNICVAFVFLPSLCTVLAFFYDMLWWLQLKFKSL